MLGGHHFLVLKTQHGRFLGAPKAKDSYVSGVKQVHLTRARYLETSPHVAKAPWSFPVARHQQTVAFAMIDQPKPQRLVRCACSAKPATNQPIDASVWENDKNWLPLFSPF